jgi:hypothetical protein
MAESGACGQPRADFDAVGNDGAVFDNRGWMNFRHKN